MDKNEQLFLNFVEGLVKYSPDDYDEGMGTVYERIMINDYFRKLIKKYDIQSVFEGPSDGITGVRGVNSLIFAKNGKKVVYYTPSKVEEEKAKEIWKNIGKGVTAEIKQGEPLKFPFEDDTFDLVWNFCIAEHFQDPIALVKEMKRVLKPGGMAMISVPVKYDLWGRFLFIGLLQKLGRYHYGYEISYTRGQFRSLLNQAGFKILDGEGYLIFPSPMRALDYFFHIKKFKLGNRLIKKVLDFFYRIESKSKFISGLGYMMAYKCTK